MNYILREIEEKDNKAVENVIRTCLIEHGGNHEGTAWADPDLGRFSEIYQGKTQSGAIKSQGQFRKGISRKCYEAKTF